MPFQKEDTRSAALPSAAAASPHTNRSPKLTGSSCHALPPPSSEQHTRSKEAASATSDFSSGAAAPSPSPTTFARVGGGGSHSPAHQSNATSPFYMGHDATGGVGAAGTANARCDARAMKENSFNDRQPTTQTNSGEEVDAAAHAAAVEAALYPVNADVAGAQLTSYEEQEPRGSAWGIPSVVVLRHRMGFSTVVLTTHQRGAYNRHDLENFVLYKEQKYNAVNVLWRFSMLVLLMLTFSVFCLVFSTCTTEWVRVEHTDNYLSLGLFVSCRDRSLRSCASRVSSRLEWTVTDAVTGGTVCTASASFVRRFIGAIWAMSILQLLCEAIALALTAWIVARPTRSGALVVLFFDLMLGTACGIAAVVLFHHYSACLRRTCEGEHLSGRHCNVSWRYGYQLYLGALAVHGVVLLLALCMHSYIHNIRVTARKQLRAERRRASRRHADAEEYMMHVLDDSMNDEAEAEGGRGSGDRGNAQHDATASSRRQAADASGGRDKARGDAGVEGAEGEGAALLPPSLQAQQQPQQGQDPLAHSSLHVSFAGVPQARRRQHSPAQDPSSARHGGLLSPLSEPTTISRINNSLRSSGRADNDAGGGVGNLSELSTRTRSETTPAAAPPQRDTRHRTQRHRNTAAYPRGSRHRPQHHVVPTTGAAKKRGSADTPAYKQARKRSRFFVRFFNREYDANYLTAAELGVPIDGADDWVYDDRSDMYYSFERDMFWDPLTREYYNCALKTWQESPDQVVEVRDVLDYMLDESEDDEAEGDEEEEDEEDVAAERATSEEHVNPTGRSSSGGSRDVDVDAGRGTRVGAAKPNHREPITPATTTGTGGGVDSSVGRNVGTGATSNKASRGAETEAEDEPAFGVDREGNSGFHSMNSSIRSN